MTLEESIKRIIEKIENDEELRKLAILLDQHPEKKDEILKAWSDDIMSIWVNNDDMNLCDYCTEMCLIGDKCVEFKWNGVIPKVEPPHHVGCKHDPAELCRQVDVLYPETFGDLDGLFKTVPCLRRFKKDML